MYRSESFSEAISWLAGWLAGRLQYWLMIESARQNETRCNHIFITEVELPFALHGCRGTTSLMTIASP
jgi:hypothetical protein